MKQDKEVRNKINPHIDKQFIFIKIVKNTQWRKTISLVNIVEKLDIHWDKNGTGLLHHINSIYNELKS